MKAIKKHTILNSIFLSGFILLIPLLMLYRNSFVSTFSLLITAALIYLIWAYLYHHLDKSLNSMIILEYVLTALLVIIILTGFIT